MQGNGFCLRIRNNIIAPETHEKVRRHQRRAKTKTGEAKTYLNPCFKWSSLPGSRELEAAFNRYGREERLHSDPWHSKQPARSQI